MKKVLILYFSGVGATKNIAERIYTRLSLDCEADMLSIENKDVPSMNGYDALIVGTPVYHGAPPIIVMRYFEILPRLTKETPAFIYSTHGLFSYNTNRLLSRKLYQKNIMTVIDKEYRCPASDGTIIAPFFKRFFAFEKDIEKKIVNDCSEFLELLNNVELRAYIPRFRFGSIINAPNKLAGQLITLKIYLHKDRCTKCSRCIEQCPHSVLFADEYGYPFFSSKGCENCYRCIHHCPNMALSLSKHRTLKKLLRY